MGYQTVWSAPGWCLPATPDALGPGATGELVQAAPDLWVCGGLRVEADADLEQPRVFVGERDRLCDRFVHLRR